MTGGIQCHEIAWGTTPTGEPDLWVVNTLFSCLVGLDPAYSFVPRWRPPFITELAGRGPLPPQRPGDARRRTGLRDRDGPDGHSRAAGARAGSPAAPSSTSRAARRSPPAWRCRTRRAGTTATLYVLNSGMGRLQRVDLATGQREIVATLPGYARGLAIHDGLAFVGLSRIRETAIFGGVPIAEYHDQLKCGVGVIDLTTGDTVATLEFTTGLEEIFDVQVVPDTRCLDPGSAPGDGDEIWVVPDPRGSGTPTA